VGAPNQEWMLVTSGGAGLSGVVVTLNGSQSAVTTLF